MMLRRRKRVMAICLIMVLLISMVTTVEAQEITQDDIVSQTTEEEINGVAENNIEDQTENVTEEESENDISDSTEEKSEDDTSDSTEEDINATCTRENVNTGDVEEKDDICIQENTEEDTLTAENEKTYSVKYNAHVQSYGWMDTVADGMVAGTSGQAKRVEALRIWVEETGTDTSGEPVSSIVSGAIRYRAHVQKYGWMDEVSDGTVAGTNGEAKRMEAIQISLNGELAQKYDIYYRAHVQSFGWLGWAKNGEKAGSADYGKRMEAIQIVLVKKGSAAPGSTAGHFVSVAHKGLVTYQAHCQSYGWMDSVADGTVAGTVGKAKRMEAIKIWLNNPTDESGNVISGGIEYRAHSQSVGWQNWVTGGNVAGTIGRGKRLEAIRIRLTGNMASRYDVYYRVHSATYGTLGWAKNGETAGSEGCSKSIESIEIKLVAKGSPDAPTQTRSYVSKDLIGRLSVQGYVQKIGWQQPVTSGGTIGTKGRGLRLEASKITIDTTGNRYKGNVYYAMYQQGTGWHAAVANGNVAGTVGQGVRSEAIKIFLSDELEKYCDIWYRAQVQGWGWLGWAKNGQEAGTKGISARLEAVQVVITPKGANAPGANAYYLKTSKKNVGDARLYSSIANRSSNTRYMIAVDTQRCLVGVYEGSQGQWSQIQQYICAPGKPSSPTVKGEFKVTGRGNAFGTPTYTCWYYTQFYGDYLFHSVLYVPGSKTQITESGLGSMASHGCVRLSIENAKWIYDHIPNGTKVFVY